MSLEVKSALEPQSSVGEGPVISGFTRRESRSDAPRPKSFNVLQSSTEPMDSMAMVSALTRCNSDVTHDKAKPKNYEEFRPSKPLDDFDSMMTQRIASHKTGFIFKKVQSRDKTLSFTKKDITKPLTISVPKNLKKNAMDVFRLIQTYMGDRRPKNPVENLEVGHQLACIGLNHKQLRDELFLQVAKQITNNPEAPSRMKGWELFVIFLFIFPPSNLFSEYIEVFIGHHIKVDDDLTEAENVVNLYASYCVQKLRKLVKTGVKRGVDPTLDEISHALDCVQNPSVFGCTISDCMSFQADSKPGLFLPWFLPKICELIIKSGGLGTEGIFRVPGDVDEVNKLKIACDKGSLKDTTDVKDPNSFGSLLKLWFRDSYEPLIPAEFYDEALKFSTDTKKCIEIIDRIPQENKLVLYFIIHFLQKFADEKIAEVTLMTTENLAMVWAPNFLRCPSEDPITILNLNKQEKAFVANLIEHLNTSEMEKLA